jgi:hypothetical protein
MEPLTFQAEDRSTNGIFINEVRVLKGESARLAHGDVLSLGKAVEDYGGASSSVRPQFRLDIQRQERSLEMLGQPSATSRELDGSGTASTSLDNQPARTCAMSSGASTAEGFAQDLLVQEQQSKAKITGELLLIRRRLDEERAVREALDRELQKARAALEDERARRSLAQESLERLQADSAQLCHEHRQLQELREEHAALETQHETVEVELGALLQRTTSLESGQEHLRMDWQRASADEVRVRAQLAEAQARLQQAQERTESLQKRHSDLRQSAEQAQECVERWQRELSSERGTREQLEDQCILLRADADRASNGECAAKEALATAEAQQAELQAQIAKCREEAATLRSRAKDDREKLDRDSQQAERFRGAGNRFVEVLRGYVDCWARGLSEGGQVAPSAHSSVLIRALDDPGLGAALSTGNAPKPLEPTEDIAATSGGAVAKDAVCDASFQAPAPAIPPMVAGTDEAIKPPVPLWEPPAAPVAVTAAEPIPSLSGAAAGPHHGGMASLIVASQDSPPAQSAGQDPRILKLEAVDDVGSVLRLASTSILSLVMPPSKRPLQAQLASAKRKRLSAR